MKASLLAALNTSERLLVAETEPARLRQLDEDQAVELHTRVRRARDKYVGQYRRGASARVAEMGARGTARPRNQHAAVKAEAFEEALARASRRLSVLAAQAAAELRAERLNAAQGSPADGSAVRPAKVPPTPAQKGGRSSTHPVGDRSRRSPASETARASTRAVGARRQARKDERHS
jgi:hypothetical protein